jgi:hypothetical protein
MKPDPDAGMTFEHIQKGDISIVYRIPEYPVKISDRLVIVQNNDELYFFHALFLLNSINPAREYPEYLDLPSGMERGGAKW